jgi:tRNA (cmo5U34)-methyltransferase
MTPTPSVWQTQALATTFLPGIRGAIPGADIQLSVLRRTAQLWVSAPSRLLDLGCGDGILGRLLLDTFSAAQATFADFSDPMLEAARLKLGANPRATIVKADFSTPEWRSAAASQAPFDIVVSGFAIHHQPDERKRSLYTEIYDLLSPGGIFLNLEHVASQTNAGKYLFDEFFIDHLLEFNLRTNPDITRQEVAETFYHRPDKIENMLAPLDVQCHWLREIGFEDVDCFCKVFELALFGGRKPSTGTAITAA